jgi:hypothetical protein
MAPQIISVNPNAPPAPVTPASQPGSGGPPSAALTQAPVPLAQDLQGRAAAAGFGGQMPTFSAAMQTDPALTEQQTGDLSNHSGFYRMMNTPIAGQGPDEYSTKLATGPSPLDYMANFFGGNKQGDALLEKKANLARSFADPAVRQLVTSSKPLYDSVMANPEQMLPVLQSAVSIGKNAPTATANGKAVDDPGRLQQLSQMTGEHPDHVHLFAEPHKYSEDEFVQAASGLSWNQAAKLFGMQHYLSPDQQAFGQLMGGLRSQADQAGQLYQQLVQSGQPQGKIDAAKAQWDAARAKIPDVLMKKGLGQMGMYPSMYQAPAGVE